MEEAGWDGDTWEGPGGGSVRGSVYLERSVCEKEDGVEKNVCNVIFSSLKEATGVYKERSR